MYRDCMTVLADKMHTNVRLYISSTQVCLHYLCILLVLATPFPERIYLAILAPYWMDAHMYRDGMTVLQTCQLCYDSLPAPELGQDFVGDWAILGREHQ